MKAQGLMVAFVFFFARDMFAEKSRVHVVTMNAFGDVGQARTITMTNAGSVVTVPSDGSILVEYGQYDLRVELDGAEPTVASVLVDQPEQIITIGIKIAAVEHEIPACSVVGRIADARDVSRVRLVQLFGLNIRDVPASSNGSFQFRNLVCGQYMVVVMGRRGCTATRITTAEVLAKMIEVKGNPKDDSCTSKENVQ